MTKVLIIAPTLAYREALVSALVSSGEIASVSESGNLEEGLDEARRSVPDVVIVYRPASEGHRLIRKLTSLPGPPVVVAFPVPAMARDVVAWAAAGAAGCVGPRAPLAELVATILEVSRGGTRCSADVSRVLFESARLAGTHAAPARKSLLTRRQAEIARLLAEGLSNKEIAQTLSIEVATVKNHVHQIFEKTGMRQRTDAVEWIAAHEGDRRG